MEGKNCFRTRWSQQPLYSGGNVATLVLPVNHAERPESLDAYAATNEALVSSCGDTVNVVRASDGHLVCHYKLPVEDVILNLDAVSVVSPSPSDVDVKEEKEVKKETEDSLDQSLTVPPGCYIAVGTRSLQIYLLQVDEVLESDTAEDADATLAPSSPKAPNERVYELKLRQSWTAAQQAISCVCFSAGGQYLISGSTDGGVKIWNAFHHHLTHNFRCPQPSVVTAVYLDPSERYLAVGTFEGHVTIFNFITKQAVGNLRPHVQAVLALTLSSDGNHMCSVARDRRLSIMSFSEDGGLVETRAIVLKDFVSAAIFESPSILHVGALDGIISSYSVSATEAAQLLCRLPKPPSTNAEDHTEEAMIQCLFVAQRPKGLMLSALPHGIQEERRPALSRSSLYAADAGFAVQYVTPSETNTPVYSVTSTLVGFLDQILEIKNLPRSSSPYRRVIINNSKDVHLYGESGVLSTRTLQGHSDIVMCCAVNADASIIATGGKDQQIRFWSTTTWATVAVGVKGHTAEVTCLSFNAKQSESYSVLFSIAADENLRMWDVAQKVVPRLNATSSIEVEHRAGVNSAHAGPVYALAVAPNDQVVATGGKDKAINLWNVTGKKVYREGALKGHRRAIAALAFSPVDRVLASASNDGSVRLWSLTSLSCVKALQADKTPVLQLSFFNAGSQVVTGNAEGVLRVWAIATSEVVWSGEVHEEKIWALAVEEEEGQTACFITGSADGVLCATEDYTAEEVERVREERHDVILKEQELANAMRQGEFTAAFLLALQLNHPRHLRQVLFKWLAKDATQCEQALRGEIIPGLKDKDLLRLLEFTREWITNSRHATVASVVMYAYLGSHHYRDIAALPAIKALIEPLLAYSQKHSLRQQELLRRIYYVDYLTRSLAPHGLTSLPPLIATKLMGRQRANDAAEDKDEGAAAKRHKTS